MTKFEYASTGALIVGVVIGLILGFLMGVNHTVNTISEVLEPLVEKINMNVTVELDEEALVNYTYELVNRTGELT